MTPTVPRAVAEHYRREADYWRRIAGEQTARAAGLQVTLAWVLLALEMAQAKLPLDNCAEK